MWKYLILCLALYLTVCLAKPKTTPSPADAGGDNFEDDEDPDAECNKKKKCADKQAYCSNNFCTCRQGFTADANGKCVKVPTVGERCDSDKANVLFCQGAGVSPVCPDSGKCECDKGYEPRGKTCVFKNQNLNEKCNGDEDCGVAYSSCQNGKCTCLSGFTVAKGLCKTDPKCPSGDVLKKGANPQSCEKKRNSNSNDNDDSGPTSDDCPTTHFCFADPLMLSQGKGEVGYCCPKAETATAAVCPSGTPLNVQKCSSDSEDANADDNGGCPALTYNCLEVLDKTACCPSPCPGNPSFFALNGRCFPTVAPGSQCKTDLECGRTAVCQDKVCACKQGFELNDNICEKAVDK